MPVQLSDSQSNHGPTADDPPIHDSRIKDMSPNAGDRNPQVALLRLLVKRAAQLIRDKQTKDCATKSGVSGR